MQIMLSTRDTDLGLVEANKAGAEAQKVANKTRKPVTLRNVTTDKIIKTVKPAAKRAASKPAPAAKSKPASDKGPRGMVVSILKLAARPKGVSPQELNDLTQWKGAPWKWLFANPKKTGYCDRHGYRLTILSPDKENPRAVRYHVKRK